MSYGNTKLIIVFFMVMLIITGCASVEKTEEISSAAPMAAQTAKQDLPDLAAPAKDVEVVPPDAIPPSVSDTIESRRLASETIQQENIKAESAPKPEQAAPAQKALGTMSASLHIIYFDYDRYVIRDSDKDNLAQNAKWFSENKTAKVRIEGHADERGEEDYNLALGDKRARGVKNYLQSMGIDPERLSTLSYGEERPAADGHDEDVWAKNRRVEFKLIN